MKNFKLTKKHKISAIMAIVAVAVLAIPSKNNSYTECGIGSVYTTHHDECELTIGGSIKLTGAFIVFFYLSLLVLERREKENKMKIEPKETNKEIDEEIQAKFDDSFNNKTDNIVDELLPSDDDYKNIPF